MSQYRSSLPQLEGGLFLTDGGIETTLIFHDGLELPYFAAFDLLKDAAAARRCAATTRATPRSRARRASASSSRARPGARAPTGANKLGYSRRRSPTPTATSIALMRELRAEYETARSPMVVSGCVGPRGDGYDPGQVMSPDEAQAYHAAQIARFADAGADMVTAITMTNADEAIGVARAAQAAGMPVAISFTVETDGRLPTGQSARRGDRGGRRARPATAPPTT